MGVLLATCTSSEPHIDPLVVDTSMPGVIVDGLPLPRAIVVHVQSTSSEAQYKVWGYSAGYVVVDNRGSAPHSVEVLCHVHAQESGQALPTVLAALTAEAPELAPGASRIVDLWLPDAEVGRLPVGVMTPVRCGTRRKGDEGPYIHSHTSWVAFSPRVAPNLRWRSDAPAIDAFHCTSWSVPIAGEPVCVQVLLGAFTGLDSEAAQAQRFAVECRLGQQTVRTEQSAGEYGYLIVEFQNVPAGEHAIRCVVDPTHVIPEGDESDNVLIASVAVLSAAQDRRHGIAVRGVDASARHFPGSGETGSPAAYDLTVEFESTAADPLRDVAGECEGQGIRLKGGRVSTFPEQVLRKGRHHLRLRSLPPLPQPGRYSLRCTLTVTRPIIEPPLRSVITADVTFEAPAG